MRDAGQRVWIAALAAAGLSAFALAAGQATQPSSQPGDAPGVRPSQPGEGGGERGRRGMQDRQTPPGVTGKAVALVPLAGMWEMEAEILGGQPGGQGEPMTERGRAVRRWVLDGAFLQEQHAPRRGEVEMGGGGQGRTASRLPGIGYFGFNRQADEFNAAWLDGETGAIHATRGEYDEASKTFTFRGDAAGSGAAAAKPVTVKLTIESDEKHTLEMYQSEQAQGDPVYRITYTRADGPAMLRPERPRDRGGEREEMPPGRDPRPMTPPGEQEPGGGRPPR